MYICKSINIHLKKYWHIQQKICIYIYIFLYTTSAAQRLQGRSPFQPQAQVKTCCEPGTPNLRLVLKRHSTVPILRGSNLMQILWSFWGSFFEGVVPLKGAFLRGWYCKNRWQQSTTHPSTHPSLKRICCIPAQILNRWQANGVPRGIRSQHFKRLQQCLIDRCLCQKETSKKNTTKTFQTTVSFGRGSWGPWS